jgi:hypothetical protein
LGLKSKNDWVRACSRTQGERSQIPADVPADPPGTYRNLGWKGWGDWLGTGVIAAQLRRYLPLADATRFVRSLGLKSKAEWDSYCKGRFRDKPPLPANIPANPYLVYEEEGFTGMGDWLGTGNIAPKDRRFRPFVAARRFARSLGFRSRTEWNAYCIGRFPDKPPLPRDIPTNPQLSYRDEGWKGNGDWLGTGNVAPKDRKFRPFRSARAFARSLGLRSYEEWCAYRVGKLRGKPAMPDDIPSSPATHYAGKGWKGYPDWLGNGRASPKRRKGTRSPR